MLGRPRPFIEIQKVNKVSVTVLDNWGNGGRDFTRTIPFDKLTAVMSKAEWDAVNPDVPAAVDAAAFAEAERVAKRSEAARVEREADAASPFGKMKESLKAACRSSRRRSSSRRRRISRRGWSTSPASGRPIAFSSRARNRCPPAPIFCETSDVVAVEIKEALVKVLRAVYLDKEVYCADFLQCLPELGIGDQHFTELGRFDRIIMNPPFKSGLDLKHIGHALRFLNPSGRW